MGVPPARAKPRAWGSVLPACRPEVLVLDVLGLSAGAASGGPPCSKSLGERAGRRDGANGACRGTRNGAPATCVPGSCIRDRSPPCARTPSPRNADRLVRVHRRAVPNSRRLRGESPGVGDLGAKSARVRLADLDLSCGDRADAHMLMSLAYAMLNYGVVADFGTRGGTDGPVRWLVRGSLRSI